MLLNSFSTALMVRDGRTYSNLMVRLALAETSGVVRTAVERIHRLGGGTV